MTKPQQESWEERFDEKFVTYPAALVCESWGGSDKNRTKKNQSILVKNYKKPYLTVWAIKRFISTERQKLLDKIIKIIDDSYIQKTVDNVGIYNQEIDSYNQALDDLLQALTKLEDR